MSRLTFRYSHRHYQNGAYVPTALITDDETTCFVRDKVFYDPSTYLVGPVVNRLYEYEELGMEPDKLKTLVDISREIGITHTAAKKASDNPLTIDKVIFNNPATIVFWKDGTKTVVKAQNGEAFDPEKGLAMAITKKALGNEGNYYNVIDKWVEEYNKPKIDVEKLLQSKRVTVTKPKLGMWIIKVTILHEDGSVVGHSQYRTMYQSKGSATRRAKQVYGDDPLVKWEVVEI